MSRIPDLFDILPEPFRDGFDPARPWELLGEALDAVLDALPSERFDSPVPSRAHLVGDRIVIGRGARIHPGATLQGPVFVGEDAEIRPGAFLRGGVWVGKGCVVGANSEVKHSILFDGARAPHLNYVGDSVLGGDCNLGAGTILSNFRHDGGEIEIRHAEGRLETGRRKLGAVLGDRVNTGCNCVLHPGVVVGAGTSLYPGAHLRSGVYPADSLVKLRQDLEVVTIE